MTSNTPQDKEGQIGFVLGKLEGFCTEMLAEGIQSEYVITAVVALAFQVVKGGIQEAGEDR